MTICDDFVWGSLKEARHFGKLFFEQKYYLNTAVLPPRILPSFFFPLHYL